MLHKDNWSQSKSENLIHKNWFYYLSQQNSPPQRECALGNKCLYLKLINSKGSISQSGNTFQIKKSWCCLNGKEYKCIRGQQLIGSMERRYIPSWHNPTLSSPSQTNVNTNKNKNKNTSRDTTTAGETGGTYHFGTTQPCHLRHRQT